MSDHLAGNKEIWIVGAGPMAIEHARVAIHLGISPIIIGRGMVSAIEFEKKMSIPVFVGGLSKFLEERKPSKNTHIIIATGSEVLMPNLLLFKDLEFNSILVEKPGAISIAELLSHEEELSKISKKIYVAYNRRYYPSVQKAIEYIEKDGGLQSLHFEFTEWSHKVGNLNKVQGVKENWFFANSTHVIDLAFYLAGSPKEIVAFQKEGNLDWHKNSFFSGAGITENDVLFSYEANWESAGSWGIILKTSKRKLILNPLETLKKMERGSITIENCDVKSGENLKDGLLEMYLDFLRNNKKSLSNLQDHIGMSNQVFRVINGE